MSPIFYTKIQEKIFIMIKKIINKLIFRIKPQNTVEQTHYQWIVHHCRSNDRVFFGPFNSYKELDAFFEDPKNERIQCSVELLISPNCPKEQYWYNPTDYLLENHSYLFDREPNTNALH
jgi:hypothetical protein